MHWKEQLKVKIESLKDEDYSDSSSVFGEPGENCATVRVNGNLPSLFSAGALKKAIACVNSNSFCGAKRGFLFFMEFSVDTKMHLAFCLRKTVPWIDDSGKAPTRLYFDFDSLP